ncbi:MAG: hypothetical protein ACPKPY_06165 [Nitrososphaeraceae archaeon]
MVNNNKSTGFFLLIVPSTLLIIFLFLIFYTNLDILVIKLTIVGLITVIVLVFTWMGYTMVTSSNNKDLEK